jgi:DNA-binding MarR family transcriptional regulator
MEPAPDRPARPGPGRASDPKGGAGRRSAGERFRVLNSFADFTLASLSRAEIAVWLILYRDTRDGTARTGMADLARRAGCDRSTVFRAAKRLERIGLLRVVRRGGPGRGVSCYRVRPLAEG